MRFVLVFVALLSSTAAAETRVALVTANDDAEVSELPPASVTPAPAVLEKPTGPSVALSVNPPSSWMLGSAIAGTMSIGVGKHNAVRLNGAWYKATMGLMDEGDIDGGTTDISIGWQVFPRRVYDGISFEADLVYRRYGAFVAEDSAAPRDDHQDDLDRIAVRGQIAYTVRMHPSFVSVGAGLSYGYEYGTEVAMPWDEPTRTYDISRMKLSPEGYVRIGVVIDP